MRLNVTIRPTVYTGQGTYRSAMDRFHYVTPSLTCFTVSNHGSYYGNITRRGSDDQYAYCFNMEIFKRGKHRKNKHYVLYVYKIDLRLLDILGMKIVQTNRNFRIVPRKR